VKQSTIDISRSLKGIAETLDRSIESIAGERIGFTLLVFTEGRASYISSVSRHESIREIKNLLSLWGQDLPDVPAHELT
jgi:hypothetical protein